MLNYLKLADIIDKDYGKCSKKTPTLHDFSITPTNQTAIKILGKIKIESSNLSYRQSNDYIFPIKFSKYLNISQKCIRLTAGGERALNLSTEILLSHDTNTVVSIPNFPRILLLAKYRSNHVKLVKVINKIEEIRKSLSGAEVVYLTNPTTPLGKYFEVEKIIELAEENEKKIFVIDMCLLDFTGQEKIVVKQLINCKNIILILSFSKCLGLPGLRLGAFISSNENILEAFDKLSSAYEISSLTLQVCEHLFKKDLSKLTKNSQYLLEKNYQLLRKSNLKDITFTDENCFITTIISKDEENLHDKLLKNGFKTLDVKYFDGMENTNGVRVSMNSKLINFIDVLK